MCRKILGFSKTAYLSLNPIIVCMHNLAGRGVVSLWIIPPNFRGLQKSYNICNWVLGLTINLLTLEYYLLNNYRPIFRNFLFMKTIPAFTLPPQKSFITLTTGKQKDKFNHFLDLTKAAISFQSFVFGQSPFKSKKIVDDQLFLQSSCLCQRGLATSQGFCIGRHLLGRSYKNHWGHSFW